MNIRRWKKKYQDVVNSEGLCDLGKLVDSPTNQSDLEPQSKAGGS